MSFNIPIKNPFNNGRSEADRRAGDQYNVYYMCISLFGFVILFPYKYEPPFWYQPEGDLSLNEVKILSLLPSLTAFARQG
jgi:hypothetical protein